MVRTVPEDDSDRKLLADIESYGWHLIGINDDDEAPAYVFSVGLYHTLCQPEICVFGLGDTAMMGRIINVIGEMMRSGQEFKDWHVSEDVLEGYPVVFRSVNESHYREHFGYCRWYYESDDFPMLQCVWPDDNGHFPWESDFDAQQFSSQPVLAAKSSWPFLEAKNTAVLTTKRVTNEGHPILLVSHDDDGDWQFLCGTTNETSDCVVVNLSNLVEEHASIAELADLPVGWRAERENASSPWRRIEPNV